MLGVLERGSRLIRSASIMIASGSLDDLHYYRDRAEHCRKAAEEATDPSVRVAHLQLAKFYEARIASALESAALQSDKGSADAG